MERAIHDNIANPLVLHGTLGMIQEDDIHRHEQIHNRMLKYRNDQPRVRKVFAKQIPKKDHQPAQSASSALSSYTVRSRLILRTLREGRTVVAGPLGSGSATGEDYTTSGISVTSVLGSTCAGVDARTRFGAGAQSTARASLGVLARRARATRRSVRRYALAMRRENREAVVDFLSLGGLRSARCGVSLL